MSRPAASSTPAPSPAARADARRNRALVLAAAQRAFAEHGPSVSLAEVARRAGVGAGTVYRHFPTKFDLLEAVMQQRVDRLAKLAAAYLDAPDPGAAFFEFCTEVVVSTPGNEALCDMVQSDDGWPRALLMSAGERFHRALGALLLAAQRQGTVRGDIEVPEVLAIFTGCVAIQRLRRSEGRIDRAAALVLDAMRATPVVTNRSADADMRNESADSNETGEPHCPVCDAQVRHTGTGRRPRYCSAACRQKAHRQRAAARRP